MKFDIDENLWNILTEGLFSLQEKHPDRAEEIDAVIAELLTQRNLSYLENSYPYDTNFAVAYGCAPSATAPEVFSKKLILVSFPEKEKIKVIQTLRQVQNLNMQDAFNKIKDLPIIIKNDISELDALHLANDFTNFGCKINIEKDDLE